VISTAISASYRVTGSRNAEMVDYLHQFVANKKIPFTPSMLDWWS
jgi:hypothetical protein